MEIVSLPASLLALSHLIWVLPNLLETWYFPCLLVLCAIVLIFSLEVFTVTRNAVTERRLSPWHSLWIRRTLFKQIVCQLVHPLQSLPTHACKHSQTSWTFEWQAGKRSWVCIWALPTAELDPTYWSSGGLVSWYSFQCSFLPGIGCGSAWPSLLFSTTVHQRSTKASKGCHGERAKEKEEERLLS